MDLKLFDKCKGFCLKIRDGIWIELNEDDLTAVLKNSNAWSESNDNCIVEENIECAIVYYANNMKRYTPLDDIVEIVGNED